LLILFVSDSITSPLPPDVLLVIVAKTALAEHWLSVVGAMGLVSTLAGNLGWLIGHGASRTIARDSLRRLREKHEQRVHRYGSWAVALGALTPVPFSITCITAGALHVPFRSFWPMTLLRIPRFYIFYVPLMYAGDVPSLF
jgi:membrane protein YqaA with SNARE-associated domain